MKGGSNARGRGRGRCITYSFNYNRSGLHPGNKGNAAGIRNIILIGEAFMLLSHLSLLLWKRKGW